MDRRKRISRVATRSPPFSVTTQDFLAEAEPWLRDRPEEFERFERFVRASCINRRAYCRPVGAIVGLGGLKERSRIFLHEGSAILVDLVRDFLERASIAPSKIDAVVFSSCSSPVIPSIDTALVNELGLRSDVLRIPIYQHGCVGGAFGLALAAQLISPAATILVAAVELCSLGFQYEDISASSLIGSALFADGAAVLLVEPGTQDPDSASLRFLDVQTTLLPDSEALMGYDLSDTGIHLRLDRELPMSVLNAAREAIPRFLARTGCEPKDIAWWLFHPGGAKILDLLETSFALSKEQTRWSWETLRDHGNMSSATLLFVLEKFLASAKEDRTIQSGDKALMVGIGPGLTVQYNLFEVECHGR